MFRPYGTIKNAITHVNLNYPTVRASIERSDTCGFVAVARQCRSAKHLLELQLLFSERAGLFCSRRALFHKTRFRKSSAPPFQILDSKPHCHIFPIFAACLSKRYPAKYSK
jgi:hypothetical protein